MSGGHFDYNCFRITNFAEELQYEIDINDNTTKDSCGDQKGMGFEEKTIERLQEVQKLISQAGKLARTVEYLYSGDHGEESALKIIDEILKNT